MEIILVIRDGATNNYTLETGLAPDNARLRILELIDSGTDIGQIQAINGSLLNIQIERTVTVV